MIATMLLLRIAAIAALLTLSPAFGKGTGGHAGHTTRAKCSSCARNSEGKIARNPQAKRNFQKSHPCPSTGATSGGCKGYVMDHVVPLERGGAVASLLHISQRTAESHKYEIMDLLGAQNPAELVHYAIRLKLVRA